LIDEVELEESKYVEEKDEVEPKKEDESKKKKKEPRLEGDESPYLEHNRIVRSRNVGSMNNTDGMLVGKAKEYMNQTFQRKKNKEMMFETM